MDNTIFDTFSVPNWLNRIQDGDASVFLDAKPMIDPHQLYFLISLLRCRDVQFSIVSWTPMDCDRNMHRRSVTAKKKALRRLFPGHEDAGIFDEIKIIRYGSPKYKALKIGCGILFDDDPQNRAAWIASDKRRIAYDPATTDILKYLTDLGKEQS